MNGTHPGGKPRVHTNGFTLIELMIVVAIIGILAAVAVPAYQDYVGTAKLTEAAPIMRPYKEMVQEFYAHRGYLPRDNAELGVPAPEQIRGSHVASVHIENGAIRTRFSATAAAEIGLNEVVTRPCVVPDSPTSPLIWGCESAKDQATNPYRAVGSVGRPGQ